jgi:hypothetical protein
MSQLARIGSARIRPAASSKSIASSLARGRFRDNDFERVCGGAIDVTDLGARLDGIQDIDGEGIAQKKHERVPGADAHGVLGRGFLEIGVVSLNPNQAGTGCLAESHAESRVGTTGGHDLVEVFGCLDEMALSENQVASFRHRQNNFLELHHQPRNRP